MLAELTRKRERAKLQRAQLQKEVVESFLFPHAARMRRVLRAVAECVSFVICCQSVVRHGG